MAELGQQLRDLIDAAARPVTADEVRQRTLHALAAEPDSRHRGRWLVAAAVLLVLAVVGAVVAVELRADDGPHVVVDDNDSHPAPTDGIDLEVVSAGVLYRVGLSGTVRVDMPVPVEVLPDAAPVRTNAGLVTLTDLEGGTGRLVIVTDDALRTLGERVYAFSVNPAGTLVAIATSAGAPGARGSSTQVGLVRIADGTPLYGTTYQAAPDSGGSAVAIGWAGPDLLLNTGDGGGARTARWRPGEAITMIGPGTVIATDPTGPRAVLASDDSGCGALGVVDADRFLATSSSMWCGPGAFSPGGAHIASVDQRDRTLVIHDAGNPVAPPITFDHGATVVDDLTWLNDEQVALVSTGTVTVCTMSASCATRAVPEIVSRSTTMLVRRRVVAEQPTTSNVPAIGDAGVDTARPPVEHLAVAITADSLDVVDTRTHRAVQRIDLRVGFARDSLDHHPEFVAIAPGKTSAIVSTSRSGGTSYALWNVDLRNGAVTLLADNALWPSFSPDGTKLAYTRTQGAREGGDTVVIRDLRDGRDRTLTRTGNEVLSRVSTTVWAPDSRRLAYAFGYYGSDTYIVDTETAADLDHGVKLAQVSLIDWRDPDLAVGYWFCCAEAGPAVVSTYRVSTGERESIGVSERLRFVDRNDQDDRIAGLEGGPEGPVVWLADTTGRSVSLPGYRHLAW